MGKPTGRADLPRHGGRVRPWLAQRMARLVAELTAVGEPPRQLALF